MHDHLIGETSILLEHVIRGYSLAVETEYNLNCGTDQESYIQFKLEWAGSKRV